MTNTFISAAISLQMVAGLCSNATVLLKKRTVVAAEIPATAASCVGFPDTAAVMSSDLGFEVKYNRIPVELDLGNELFVGQLIGGRLPEGSTTLPEGFSFRYDKYLVAEADGRSQLERGRILLANAFSGQMISGDADLLIEKVEPKKVPATAESCIGHADTAAVAGSLLGREVPFNRASISLQPGDVLYVCQLGGGRLPEGSTTLPEGFTLTFYKVSVLQPA